MRGRLLTVAAAVAILLAAAAPASAGRAIELVDGTGRAYLSLRGALLGSLERGRVTVNDLPSRRSTEVIVQGYDWVRVVNRATTVYGGRELRFRVFAGRWRVHIQGTGIDAAAAGLGFVGLRGEGLYSLGGDDYQPWPQQYRRIRLGRD